MDGYDCGLYRESAACDAVRGRGARPLCAARAAAVLCRASGGSGAAAVWQGRLAVGALTVGLFANLFWNPPYPFPFENNYAMVDFVSLQQAAAGYLQTHTPHSAVATAWPYSAALGRPDYGYVDRPLRVVETNDFHFESVRKLPASRYDALVVYTRTWTPPAGLIRFAWVRALLTKFYEYEPEIDERQCESLGLHPAVSWAQHGQTITVYERSSRVGGNSSAHAADEPQPR